VLLVTIQSHKRSLQFRQSGSDFSLSCPGSLRNGSNADQKHFLDAQYPKLRLTSAPAQAATMRRSVGESLTCAIGCSYRASQLR